MKKLFLRILLFALFVLACLQASAQISTKYIFQYSTATVPPTNYFVLLDPGNGAYQKSTIQALGTVIGNFLSITNGGGSFTNVTVITINSTTNINQYSYTTNLYATTINVTTNISNYSYSTNVTVAYPGGFTNLNLTPSTLIWANAIQEESSIPNSAGMLTNNGSGAIGWSLSLSLTELDVANLFATNLFLTITNKAIATDGNGQATGSFASSILASSLTDETGAGLVPFSGSPTLTNSTIKGDVFGTNAFFITTWGVVISNNINQVIISNGTIYATGPIRVTGVTNSGLAASQFKLTDANKGETTSLNEVTLTNGNYSLPTNNLGGGALVFGGPGTAATLYDTNITAATTLKLFDITACGATAGGFKLYCTCSGGTDRILTFPAGCTGAGLGTPPAVTITNAKGAWFDVIYKPGAVPRTNVFWSPEY